jgi:predicted RNA-binding Zn-ribbon protein involved in translation (DUF1610 family)
MKYGLMPLEIVLIAMILIGQATWIFIDAGKRGERRLLWGLFGLLSCPSSLIVYLLVTRRKSKSKDCPACGHRMERAARFCPACGKEQVAPASRK